MTESQVSGRNKQTSAGALSRRSFLQAGAAAGGGLLLSLSLPFAKGEAEAASDDTFAPNAFVRIQKDGQVVLTMPYVEMGQGTYTSIPMLIAEELEVDLKQVRLEHAPPNEKLYVNPLLGRAGDGQLERDPRGMGADAQRRCSRQNHARCGGGGTLECRSGDLPRAKAAKWSTRQRGRRLGYGELAADAARMPVPENVALKPPQEFKLIGTPAKRLDTPAKVNGTAIYRNRCSPTRREDRDPGAIACVRRPGEERGRHRGQGRQRRSSDRAARRCRRRRGGSHGCGEEGARGAGDRMG